MDFKRFVNRIVRKYMIHKNISKNYYKDLIQAGYEGYLFAKKSYDETKNSSFYNWARTCVQHYINNYANRFIFRFKNNTTSLNSSKIYLDYDKVLIAREVYDKLNDFDKFLLKLIFIDGYSPVYISKKYNIPRHFLLTYISNMEKYFKNARE
jgi:DNA-directed RNA polymerase specialized sigma subunit